MKFVRVLLLFSFKTERCFFYVFHFSGNKFCINIKFANEFRRTLLTDVL